jgi:hypothetical protein
MAIVFQNNFKVRCGREFVAVLSLTFSSHLSSCSADLGSLIFFHLSRKLTTQHFDYFSDPTKRSGLINVNSLAAGEGLFCVFDGFPESALGLQVPLSVLD